MADVDRHYRFRDELAGRLTADLLGPVAGADEILREEPATAYVTGVLFPRDRGRGRLRERAAEEDGDDAPATMAKDEVPDTGVAMANRQMPAAMGLTFAVDTGLADALEVTVRGARYESIDAEGRVIRPERSERGHTEDEHAPRWRRLPFETVVRVSLEVGGTSSPLSEVAEGLDLRTRVRPPDADGVVAVTLTLVNGREAPPKELLDPYCFFQPQMQVAVPDGAPALVERPHPRMADEDELRLSALLHRHVPIFATGHGCAADWDWDQPSARGARPVRRAGVREIRTSFVPTREVLLADSNPEVTEPGMLALADSSDDELAATLRDLVQGYERWIADRDRDASALAGSDLDEVAQQQLDACREASARMRGGIDLLARDPDVGTAFRLACRTMAEQRARTVWMRSGSRGEPDVAAGRWRPFQIGFILLCLNGIADPEHADRGIADVLWFPTGGGKTEAYLGLIAFTTFLRRLRGGAAGGGVTILMRYTLRLLTLQQFERAATLICAMEQTRAGRDDLGSEPVSIGMWVGRAATPNTLKEAQESLRDLARNKPVPEKNPVQLRSCPWCGTALDHMDHHVDAALGRMQIRCPNEACHFRGGLPVHVVDEAIYAARPTLIIATADKFAQVAWREQVATLFNREGAPEGTPPPELVIQDELHLISGPLGTMAGLYETVVDVAADRPKVVASTATIRRAQQQGVALFRREVRQFPPAGLDARDSWFAVEAPREAKASRRYVGVLAPGTSQATLLIRVYSALLHEAHRIDGEPAVRDAYWTLVGYFNSLRLLAAADLQVRADVVERLQQLAQRDATDIRAAEFVCELTSRVPSSRIPEHLKSLFVAHPDRNAIDLVLATNMISVGVDVDRLGLMAVMGQPQTTAEYIQATSRVGRSHPGLVVAMLNASRSRDRSHYEDFVPYHSALYRQVESTSVTPFASRARDRGLHAVLVGLVRMLHPIARPNAAAAAVGTFREELARAKDVIMERVRAVDPSAAGATEDELDEFVLDWEELARVSPGLVYEARWRAPGAPERGPDTALLRSFVVDDDLENATETMWSLRDVDVETELRREA